MSTPELNTGTSVESMSRCADKAGPALFQLVRFWSRRWVTQASQDLPDEIGHVRHVLVVEAVHAGRSDVTVNTVARQLGVDHSGASRMVKEAITAGYLTRADSPQDRRRASLKLTGQGRRFLDGSHQWQRQTFDSLTADWNDHDRNQFGIYLQRLASQLDLIDD